MERRRTGRRQHGAGGSVTASGGDLPQRDGGKNAVYWVGDERDTTQGDW